MPNQIDFCGEIQEYFINLTSRFLGIYVLLIFGGVAEWLNAAVLKTVESSRAPGVRIPPPPQGLQKPLINNK